MGIQSDLQRLQSPRWRLELLRVQTLIKQQLDLEMGTSIEMDVVGKESHHCQILIELPYGQVVFDLPLWLTEDYYRVEARKLVPRLLHMAYGIEGRLTAPFTRP